MSAQRRMRAVGAYGHLLLVVVLALGVFVMHTVGHPDSSSGSTLHGSAAGATAHGSAGATAAHSAMAPMAMATPAQARAVEAEASAHSSDHDKKASSHGPGMRMDMASLCVAVLGGWILAGLLRAVLGRRTDWLVRLRVGAMAALRPNPPPPRPDLAQLSILRI
ncbi:DUF6153 family protein [Streptomyces sp. NPDC002446]